MDTFTKRHLEAWLKNQFPLDRDYGYTRATLRQLKSKMIAIYRQDPAFWGSRGWWKVYDVATQEAH